MISFNKPDLNQKGPENIQKIWSKEKRTPVLLYLMTMK